MNKQGLININNVFKKCVQEREERKTHGGKKIFLKRYPFEDRRRWLNSVCLCNELETEERRKIEDAGEEA